MSSIYKRLKDFLTANGLDNSEARAEGAFIIKELSNLTAEQIYSGSVVENEDILFKTAKQRIETGLPIHYILGCAYFMGEKFFVNNSVLIPRDETEFLVRKTVECAKKIRKEKSGKISILDIGTGSGIIPYMVSKLLIDDSDVEITGVDISTQALKVAISNMENLGQEGRVMFRKSNLFSSIKDTEKYDIIVSNPPYIPLSEKGNLQDEVKKFEPPLALFTNDKDGMEFYKKIIETAQGYLKDSGFLIFEAGINQASMIKKLLSINNYTAYDPVEDLSGIQRVVFGRKIN